MSRSGIAILGVGSSLAIAAAMLAAVAQAEVCEVPEPFEEYQELPSIVYTDDSWRRFKCPAYRAQHPIAATTGRRQRQLVHDRCLRLLMGM